MLTKSFALLPVLFAACATDAPSSGSLPEGRYQLTWTCLDATASHDNDPLLVQQHQLVVRNGQLAFDSITVPISYYDGSCACTDPIGNIPAFMLCADNARTMSGSIAWGWQSWAFTATPVTATH